MKFAFDVSWASALHLVGSALDSGYRTFNHVSSKSGLNTINPLSHVSSHEAAIVERMVDCIENNLSRQQAINSWNGIEVSGSTKLYSYSLDTLYYDSEDSGVDCKSDTIREFVSAIMPYNVKITIAHILNYCCEFDDVEIGISLIRRQLSTIYQNLSLSKEEILVMYLNTPKLQKAIWSTVSKTNLRFYLTKDLGNAKNISDSIIANFIKNSSRNLYNKPDTMADSPCGLLYSSINFLNKSFDKSSFLVRGEDVITSEGRVSRYLNAESSEVVELRDKDSKGFDICECLAAITSANELLFRVANTKGVKLGEFDTYGDRVHPDDRRPYFVNIIYLYKMVLFSSKLGKACDILNKYQNTKIEDAVRIVLVLIDKGSDRLKLGSELMTYVLNHRDEVAQSTLASPFMTKVSGALMTAKLHKFLPENLTTKKMLELVRTKLLNAAYFLEKLNEEMIKIGLTISDFPAEVLEDGRAYLRYESLEELVNLDKLAKKFEKAIKKNQSKFDDGLNIVDYINDNLLKKSEMFSSKVYDYMLASSKLKEKERVKLAALKKGPTLFTIDPAGTQQVILSCLDDKVREVAYLLVYNYAQLKDVENTDSAFRETLLNAQGNIHSIKFDGVNVTDMKLDIVYRMLKAYRNNISLMDMCYKSKKIPGFFAMLAEISNLVNAELLTLKQALEPVQTSYGFVKVDYEKMLSDSFDKIKQTIGGYMYRLFSCAYTMVEMLPELKYHTGKIPSYYVERNNILFTDSESDKQLDYIKAGEGASLVSSIMLVRNLSRIARAKMLPFIRLATLSDTSSVTVSASYDDKNTVISSCCSIDPYDINSGRIISFESSVAFLENPTFDYLIKNKLVSGTFLDSAAVFRGYLAGSRKDLMTSKYTQDMRGILNTILSERRRSEIYEFHFSGIKSSRELFLKYKNEVADAIHTVTGPYYSAIISENMAWIERMKEQGLVYTDSDTNLIVKNSDNSVQFSSGYYLYACGTMFTIKENESGQQCTVTGCDFSVVGSIITEKDGIIEIISR